MPAPSPGLCRPETEAADLGRVSGAQAAPGLLMELQGSLRAQAWRGGVASPPAGLRPHTRPLGPEPRSGARRRESWRWRRAAGLGTATQTQTEARREARARPRRGGGPEDWRTGREGRRRGGGSRPWAPWPRQPGRSRLGGCRASSRRPARAPSPPTAGWRGRGRGCGPSCCPRQAHTNKVAELIDQVGAIYLVHSRVKCSNKNLWTSASCFNVFLLLKLKKRKKVSDVP